MIHGTHPTKADVRAAAHSLAPPGYTVTSERLNAYEGTGAWFATASYAVDSTSKAAARSRTGCRLPPAGDERGLAGREDAGRAVLHPSVERPGSASVAAGRGSIGEEGGVSSIQAFRLKEPSIGPFFAFAGIGALVGLAIALVVGFLVLRRQRPVGP